MATSSVFVIIFVLSTIIALLLGKLMAANKRLNETETNRKAWQDKYMIAKNLVAQHREVNDDAIAVALDLGKSLLEARLKNTQYLKQHIIHLKQQRNAGANHRSNHRPNKRTRQK